jgi:Rieske Fe-S protein
MTHGESACRCKTLGRREFIEDGTRLMAGALAALGLTGEAAAALPVTFGRASGASGDQRTYPVPAADGATIDRENQVIVVRFQNQAFAFLLSCPHQNTALRWLAPEGRFQCPRHESKYKPDGTFIEGRATRNMDRFAIARNGNTLVVALGRWFQSDTQKPEWTAAVAAL